MVYIIIPVFNRWRYTEACLISLSTQNYKLFKIIVVDHGSSDGTSENITFYFPQVVLLKGDETMWWTKATNLGVNYALQHSATYILTLNNDLIVNNNYLKNLVTSLEKESKSLIGSISVDIKSKEHIIFAGTKWNKRLAKYSMPIPLNLAYSEFSEKYDLIESDLLPGRGTLIPCFVFSVIGFFDEKRFPHYMADEDFSDRAKNAGFNLYVNTKAVVYSHVDATGLNKNTKKKNILSSLHQALTSTKSPNNVFTRWNWAKKSKFTIPYFIIDFGRVLLSQLLK